MCWTKEEQQTARSPSLSYVMGESAAPARKGIPTFDEFIDSLPLDRREGFSWSEVNEKERTYNFSFATTVVQRTITLQNVLFVGVKPSHGGVDTHYVVTAQDGTLRVARIPFNKYVDIVTWVVGDDQPVFAL